MCDSADNRISSLIIVGVNQRTNLAKEILQGMKPLDKQQAKHIFF